MMVAIEADDAWWPPTLRPSRASRRWLALWIVQADSQWTLRSSSPIRSRSSLARRRADMAGLVSPLSCPAKRGRRVGRKWANGDMIEFARLREIVHVPDLRAPAFALSLIHI